MDPGQEPDDELEPELCAERGSAIIERYRNLWGAKTADDAVVAVLSSFMHAAERLGLDMDDVVRRARVEYLFQKGRRRREQKAAKEAGSECESPV